MVFYVLIASTDIHDAAQLLIYHLGIDESLMLQRNRPFSAYVWVGHLARQSLQLVQHFSKIQEEIVFSSKDASLNFDVQTESHIVIEMQCQPIWGA